MVDKTSVNKIHYQYTFETNLQKFQAMSKLNFANMLPSPLPTVFIAGVDVQNKG